MKHHYLPLILLALSSCDLSPDYQKPDMPTPQWRGASSIPDNQLTQDWWGRFGSEEMDALVTESLQSNNDVKSAIYRVEQARASATIAGASLLPTVDATANAGRNTTNPAHGATSSVNSYRGGMQVNYEVDLFGRNRSNTKAALSAAQASEFDKNAIALIVQSDTAQGFISLLALGDRLQIARDTLDQARDVLRITQARFDAGTLSALELAQQKIELAGSEASIASLAQQREAQLNQLAVLLGKPPQDFSVKSTTLAGFTLPEIAPLQPSELITRRPDIRAAEAQLTAANYDIGAARAAFYPNFQLSANAALGATPASAPVALSTALAAAIAQPIFSGGTLTGQLDLAKARRGEAEEQYKKIVLISFQEVQDALAAQQRAKERVAQYLIASEQSQTAYNLVRQRFDAGAIDFLTLIDAQRNLFSAQDILVTAKQEQFAAAIDLYRALGGAAQ